MTITYRGHSTDSRRHENIIRAADLQGANIYLIASPADAKSNNQVDEGGDGWKPPLHYGRYKSNKWQRHKIIINMMLRVAVAWREGVVRGAYNRTPCRNKLPWSDFVSFNLLLSEWKGRKTPTGRNCGFCVSMSKSTTSFRPTAPLEMEWERVVDFGY